jgi:hypothetical protein
VDSGEADLALLTARASARPGAVELGSDEVVLVLPRSHELHGQGRIDLRSAADLELVMIRPYQAIFDELAAAARAATGGREPTVRWIGNLTTLLGLVDSEGSRVALMTRRAALRHAISPDRLLSVSGVDIRRYYSLFPSRYSARRSSVALLRDHLEASLPFQRA